MNPFKPAVLFLGLSLGVHAAMGWSLIQHFPGGSAVTEPIQISFLEYPKPKPVEKPLQAAPKQRLRGIPIPRLKPVEAPPIPAEVSDFQKSIEKELKKQRKVIANLAAPDRPVTPSAKPKTGVEIMADPKKGKVYVNYFGEMKKQIQETLLERFARRYSGKGMVTLLFVVNAQGFLEKVSISPKDTHEDEMLRDMAVQCLHEAAPFKAFPPDLGSDRIVFAVTFFFDGR